MARFSSPLGESDEDLGEYPNPVERYAVAVVPTSIAASILQSRLSATTASTSNGTLRSGSE